MLRVPPEPLLPGAWAPKVSTASCLGDADCMKVCRPRALAWDVIKARPVVQYPDRCFVGCQACAIVCETGVITFPEREKMRSMLQQTVRRRLPDEEEYDDAWF